MQPRYRVSRRAGLRHDLVKSFSEAGLPEAKDVFQGLCFGLYGNLKILRTERSKHLPEPKNCGQSHDAPISC